jgi:hypothetical protein
MKANQLKKAREQARSFANPRSLVGNTPKTGTFTGFWKYTGKSWHGSFVEGIPQGLFTYYCPKTQNAVLEFYCNL